MNSFTIKTSKGGRQIGGDAPTFVIAEVSANHNQKLEKAIEIVHAVAEAGADAVKFQTYTPDTLTIDCDKNGFVMEGDENPWKGAKLYDLYKTAYTPWEWLPQLKEEAEKVGLFFFSTVYDITATDFMEKMDVGMYKIASYEVPHIPLLRRVAKTGKPVIMSIGFATEEEARLGIDTLRENGVKDLVILHCSTTYTAEPDFANLNLKNIADIKVKFDVIPGFSENIGGTKTAAMAVLAGAKVIEKHVMSEDSEKTPDSDFSVTPSELKIMIEGIREAEKVLGKVHYGPANEKEAYNAKHLRQSLFVVGNVKQGEKFTEKNVRAIRPGIGMAPKYLDEILGKEATQDIERGTPMDFKFVEEYD